MPVSVVIPAYNSEKTLAATVDSALAQTVRPREIVIVNDQSTDGTRAVAESYLSRVPTLKVITLERNSGVSGARNAGIAASDAELVAPLDADDVWHPTFLEKTLAALERRPGAGMAYSFFRWIDMDGRVLRDRPSYGVDGWGFYQLMERNYIANGSNVVYRRDLVDGIGGFDRRISGREDRMLQLEMAWRRPVTHVSECLVGYRVVAGSITSKGRRQADLGLSFCDLLAEKIPQIDRGRLRRLTAQRHLEWIQMGRKHSFLTPSSLTLHLVAALMADPGLTLAKISEKTGRSAAASRREAEQLRANAGRDFFEVDPRDGAHLPLPRRLLGPLAVARQYDERLATWRAATTAP